MVDLNSTPNIVPPGHPKHKNLVPIVIMGLALIAVAAVFTWYWLSR